MKRSLTDAQVDECCQRYANGESGHSIAKSFGVRPTTICYWLKARGIPLRDPHARKLTEFQIDEVCRLYRSGIHWKSICEAYGIGSGILYRYLSVKYVPKQCPKAFALSPEERVEIVRQREQGVSSRQLAARYGVSTTAIKRLPSVYDENAMAQIHAQLKYCDHHYFDHLSSEEVCYWIGFIAADGCITDESTLSIALQLRDADHLERFQSAIRTNYPVHQYVYKKRSFCSIVIQSEDIVSALEKHGLSRRKTEKIRWSAYPESALRHFLRGYSDGDGCFHVSGRYPQLAYTLIGNRPFISECQRHLIRVCALNRVKINNHRKSRGVVTFRYLGNAQNIRIANYLYEGATIFLPRKRDIVLNHYCALPKYRGQLRFG